MNRRLVRAIAAYGVLLGGGTVGVVYAVSTVSNVVFGRWALVMAVGGFILGPLMFARAGAALRPGGADLDADGVNSADEMDATSFVTDVGAAPPKGALGIYLLGVGVFAVLGLVAVA